MPILYILEIIWTVCFRKSPLWPHPWVLSNSLWTTTSLVHPLPLKLHAWSFMPLELHPSLDGVCRWQVLTKSNGLATCFQGICLKEFVSREFVSMPDLFRLGKALLPLLDLPGNGYVPYFCSWKFKAAPPARTSTSPPGAQGSFCKTPNYHICNRNNLCIWRPDSAQEEQARRWR